MIGHARPIFIHGNARDQKITPTSIIVTNCQFGKLLDVIFFELAFI